MKKIMRKAKCRKNINKIKNSKNKTSTYAHSIRSFWVGTLNIGLFIFFSFSIICTVFGIFVFREIKPRAQPIYIFLSSS